MDQHKNVPAIRFKGFQEEWKKYKVNALGSIITGSTPSTQISEYYSKNGIPWVTPTDIYGLLTDTSLKKLSVLGAKKARVVPPNTILVTCIASIGKNTILCSEGSFNQQINALVPNSNKFDYYFLFVNSFNWSEIMKKIAAIGTMQIVNKTEFSNILTYIPKLPEQTQIGNFFKNIDEQINLQEQKHQKLVNLKKAMLEKMFPKEGANVPEIRFKGFTEKWEEKKLNYYVTGLIGGVSITPDDYTDEGIRTIPKGSINEFGKANLSDCKFVSYSYASKFKNNQVKANEIITSLRDLVPTAPNLGRIVKISGEEETFLMPQGVYKLVLNKKINESFLIILSNTDNFRDIIFANKSGSTQVHMRNQEFLNLENKFPSLEEQQKIGAYFEQLDNLIQQSQVKIEKYKNIKQALLQKMFV